MRQIKFRAWDGEKMHVVLQNRWVSSAFYLEEQPIMQFTGLLDSKGVEIYEGDIVKDENRGGGITEVKWNCGGWEIWVTYNEVNATFGAKEFSGIRFGYWVDEAMNNLEIIGNVWENGELLKQ